MTFSKTCPVCKQFFSSLVSYMSHIKSDHAKIPPKDFLKDNNELTWSFRTTD